MVGKTHIIIGLVAVILLAIGIYWGALFFQSTDFMRGRNTCDYFSPKDYEFQGYTLKVTNEECKTRDGDIWLFYTVHIENKQETPITWSLADFSVMQANQGVETYFDSLLSTSPNSAVSVNQSRDIELYSVLIQESGALSIENDGIRK